MFTDGVGTPRFRFHESVAYFSRSSLRARASSSSVSAPGAQEAEKISANDFLKTSARRAGVSFAEVTSPKAAKRSSSGGFCPVTA